MSLEVTLERVTAIRQALANPAALVGSGGALAGGTEAPGASATTAGGASSFASALEQASAGYGPPEGSSGASAAALGSAALGSPTSSSAALGSPALSAAALGSSSLAGAGSPYSLQSPDGVAGSSALSPAQLAAQGTPGARMVAIAESQLGQSEQPPGSNESPAIAQYRTATAGALPGEPWCAYFASWVARQAGEPIGEGGQGAGAVGEVWSWAQRSGRAIANGPGVVPQPGDLIVFGDEHVGIVRDVLPNGQIQTIEGNYENKVAANVRSPTEATGYVNMS
jgi:CHAP domain